MEQQQHDTESPAVAETPEQRRARVGAAIREGRARAARERRSTAAGKAISAGMAKARAAKAEAYARLVARTEGGPPADVSH